MDIQARIDQGHRIVKDYNRNRLLDEQLCFVVTVKRAVAALG